MKGKKLDKQEIAEVVEKVIASKKSNKLVIPVILLALVVVVLGFMLFRKMNSDGRRGPRQMEQNVNTSKIDSSFTGPIKTFTIDGSSFKYDPSTITVNKGDGVKITFKDDDGRHNLKIDNYGVSSNVLGAGSDETLEFVADKAGTFEYYCSLPGHKEKGMVGTLIVK